MALYLGNSDKLKIYSNNVACRLNLFSAPIAEAVKLLSSDGYILFDSDDYLLVSRASNGANILTTIDDYAIYDTNKLKLTTQGG